MYVTCIAIYVDMFFIFILWLENVSGVQDKTYFYSVMSDTTILLCTNFVLIVLYEYGVVYASCD